MDNVKKDMVYAKAKAKAFASVTFLAVGSVSVAVVSAVFVPAKIITH